MDESVEECKEAIMILESCTKDFRNLIEWLRLKWNYEQTPPPQRPNSLAWEVRKSSPSKVLTVFDEFKRYKTLIGVILHPAIMCSNHGPVAENLFWISQKNAEL